MSKLHQAFPHVMNTHFRRNIIAIIFFAATLSTTAQVRLDRPEMYVGANFGMTGSMVMFKPAVTQGYLIGYNGGVVFRYIAEKNVGMQAELNLSQRGWSEKSGLYVRQLNYLEIPFMTHIYMGNKSRFFLNFGPKISYLLSENVLKNETSNIESQHITSIENKLDYGLCAGIGLLFKLQGNVFQLDTRANYGLSDIFSSDKRDYFDTSNNVNVSVNLAWMLQLK